MYAHQKAAVLVILLGCGLFFTVAVPAGDAGPDGGKAPTFSNEVVRLFQANCQVCHRPGDIAPFSLLTYRDAAPRALAIKRAVQTRRMPPWKPAAGCSEFRGDRRLSDDAIRTIVRWADAGAPEGDPAELPPPVEFPTGWRMGEPDVLLSMRDDYTPHFTRIDEYRCFSIPIDLKEDTWISGFEIQPGNRRVVHHAGLYIDPKGASEQLEAESGGVGYDCFGDAGGIETIYVGDWVPGSSPRAFPPGIGLRLPGGARMVLEVHYSSLAARADGAQDGGCARHDSVETPEAQQYVGLSDAPPSDRSRAGLYLASEPPEQEVQLLYVPNEDLFIPAGAPRHREQISYRVDYTKDIKVFSVFPHMHLLGREVEATITPPDGEPQCMIRIDNWDFNWQGWYDYSTPVRVSPDSLIELTAYFDNSPNNPRNPSRPPVDVYWGGRAMDEMMFVAFLFVEDDEPCCGSNDERKTLSHRGTGKRRTNSARPSMKRIPPM